MGLSDNIIPFPLMHSTCTENTSRPYTDRLVLGIGGAGCSIVDTLVLASDIRIVCINTDISSLDSHPTMEHLTIGSRTCNGMAANVPDRGKRAAKESSKEIAKLLSGAREVFLIAGLGGGTGSGALPVIADLAQEMGITVHIAVTMPFKVEPQRREVASITKEWLCSSPHEIYIYDFSDQPKSSQCENFSLELILKDVDKSISDKIIEWMS